MNKKILYVASNMTHISNFHGEYISALRELGYTVRIMARGEGADYNLPFEKKLFSLKNTACRREIRAILKRERFDAVILNTTLAAFHVRLAMPKKNRPRVINIVHGYLFSKHTGILKRALLLFCERFVVGKTDSIIVMNSEDELIARKNRLCLGEVRKIDGMGVSLREVITPPEIIAEQNGRGRFSLLFVGELSPRKNQELLVRAMPLIKREIPNAVLWLVGEGTIKDTLVSLAATLGVSDSVIFFGKRSDACDFMRAADLYVSAADIEGLPFNIVEALGSGKFVVASDIKGHSDVINDSSIGILFSANDKNALAECVIRTARERPSDTGAAKQRYDYFSKERVFPLTLRVITDLLKQHYQ